MLKFGSKNDVTVVHRATIRLLDDAEIIHCDFQPQHKGRYILEYVCKQLNIIETDYFGLRYVDHCRQRHWLDLAKTAIKQVKDMEPILFSFRVKFYPPDPLRLKEEITRYQIYQQLKRDLLHGRLYCSPGEAALLAACILHNELGEYDPEIHVGNYMSEHKLLLKQTESIEEKAMELHQTQLKTFTAEQAEIHFLRLAAQLDTYAVDPHPVKDHKGTQLYVGINHHGILTFQGSRKTNHFRWSEVQKINYEGKMFIVHLTIHEKKHTVGFKCPTGSNCRHVWRCAIEQMLFFTLPRASDAPVVSGGSIFSWGTKFKYTGRTEREVLEETAAAASAGSAEASSLRGKGDTPVQRCQTTGLRRKASSVPATPSTPSQDLIEIRYSSLPRSCHSAGLDGAGMSESGSTCPGIGVPLSSPYCPDNTLPLLETVSEDQEIYAKRNNALDENEKTHASAHYTTTTSNQMKKVKFPKSTYDRPQTLYSQKIVIGSDELIGRNIDKVVRQKIDSLEKSPKVVRSTALIIKTSRTPVKPTNSIIKPGNITSEIKTYTTTIHNKPCETGVKSVSLAPLPPTIPPRVKVQAISLDVSDAPEMSKCPMTIKNDNDEVIGKPAVNGNATSGRSITRPMAFALAMASAAAAAVSSNVRGTTAMTPITIDDNTNKNGHDTSVGGPGDGDTNDYFFRDSFDHSSSESQLVDGIGNPHSRSLTPVPKMQKLQNTKLCLQPVGSRTIIGRAKALRGIRIVRMFVSAFVLTVTMLFIVIVLVFETESTVFDSLRKTPEMVAFKSQYYVPIREFLRTKLGLF
ncbi:protein 4.1 isoform X2 [Fopius arisanus]|uniref:Frmd5_0 protein n=1 Tax=Fopius arisanus TaxID=64838 RepID=A0A0C9QUZ1_9HYME|nr:PREDICTED: protein 4.1 isoform X2 [Fopius arisanus]